MLTTRHNSTSRSLILLLLLSIGVAECWIPQDDHPCTVTQFTVSEFLDSFGTKGVPPLYKSPLVIRDRERNAKFQQLTEKDAIIDFFGADFLVTLTSSNSLSENRRTVTLAQYINETLTAKETLPDQLSNETWYLFGQTFSDDWMKLFQNYDLPLCHTCSAPLVALSFGIGNRGSGVQWHVHGPGFSEAVHGRKHWVLYPPEQTPPSFHKDQSSRQWMEQVYSLVTPKPFECTLNPGDLIYFPDMWWHATINLDPYTAFISSFTTEHNVAMLHDEL